MYRITILYLIVGFDFAWQYPEIRWVRLVSLESSEWDPGRVFLSLLTDAKAIRLILVKEWNLFDFYDTLNDTFGLSLDCGPKNQQWFKKMGSNWAVIVVQNQSVQIAWLWQVELLCWLARGHVISLLWSTVQKTAEVPETVDRFVGFESFGWYILLQEHAFDRDFRYPGPRSTKLRLYRPGYVDWCIRRSVDCERPN